MSNNAQPFLVVHCSCGAELFSFGFANVGIVLYLMVLKTTIWLFNTTINNALRRGEGGRGSKFEYILVLAILQTYSILLHLISWH